MANGMKLQYLLDTNVILRKPMLLARSDAAELFLIPTVAINQLSNRGHGMIAGPLHRVLIAASNSGVEVIESSHTSPLYLPTSDNFRLDECDVAILEVLLELQSDTSRTVCLVTEDRLLRKAAIQIGLKAISLGELQEALDKPTMKGAQAPDTATNFEVEEQVKKYEKFELSNIKRVIAIGGLAIGIAVVVWYKYQQIFSLFAAIPQVFIALAALASGALLYWFRQKYRPSYGMVETVIGVWISVNAFPLQLGIDVVASGLQVLGGLYVVVRGLDNVGNGLKGTRYAPIWQKFFG